MSARRDRPAPGTAPPSARPAMTMARASLWRSPPERSRGSASVAQSSPVAASAARPASPGSSAPTRSRTSRSPGLCGQRAQPAGGRHPAADRIDAAGGRSKQRRLAGAVSAHEGDALATGDRQSRSRAARRGAPLPSSSSTHDVAGVERPSSPRVAMAGGFRSWRRLVGGLEASMAQHSSRLLDPGGRWGDPGELEEPRPGSRERRIAVERPSQEPSRRAVECDPPARHRDRAVGRPQAALEPVLGDDARPSPTPRSAAAAAR